MMKTRYQTIILRFHLDETLSAECAEHKLTGSVQQVGQPTKFFFDSAEKLQETIQRMVAESISKEVKNDDQT